MYFKIKNGNEKKSFQQDFRHPEGFDRDSEDNVKCYAIVNQQRYEVLTEDSLNVSVVNLIIHPHMTLVDLRK